MAIKIGCKRRKFYLICNYSFLIFSLFGLQLFLPYVTSVPPKFDSSTLMKLVLVPSDAQVGSVIYRLRATDAEIDYPLTFELIGDITTLSVRIESLPCTKQNSICQANVILSRRLEAGRYYDFQVIVKNTKGESTRQLCSITATNFTTPHDTIFPHKPGIIQIPENAKKGTELDYVIARKNVLLQKPVYLELWGSPLFALRQKIIPSETTEGTIFLLGQLDFEKQAMYHLKILANDAYAEPGQDTRNIAGIDVVVIVQDVQDQPPVFVLAPPVTKLEPSLLPGDKVSQVHAEDGDKGSPREVRYGLVSEGNPFTSFFDINDTSGEIFLMRPLEDIAALTHIGDPVLLTIVAEEVKVAKDEPPAMSSTVQLAFFLPERTNTAPYFENDHYVARLDENSPPGTTLTFFDPYVARVYDDDVGKNGVFALTLLNNNGTFEISPNVAERSTTFFIRVRDNILLDYEERSYVEFQILAQELGPVSNLSAHVNVTVYLNDQNDNPPVFDETLYIVELPENMTAGTKVVNVHATDLDSVGLGGKIKYTQILGYLNTSLNLDSINGTITVVKDNHGFDREVMPEYHLYVEAADNDGTGNRAQVPMIIKLIDVNDETPVFEKDLYEFILAPDFLSFSHPAFIHATDKDATAPNNEVRYEIINGNYENKIEIDNTSGELSINDKITFNSKSFQQKNSTKDANLFILTARAYDLGVPVKYSTTVIRIYPPESRVRTLTFLVPGLKPNKEKTEETLSALTGGKVIIHEIRPLSEQEQIMNSASKPLNRDRSIVTATVLYDSSSIVDVYHIQQRLLQQNSSVSLMVNDSNNSDELYKAENKLLFWLLILLAALVALTILILLLCCICSWCPLYGGNSKRIVNISRTEDDVHLVHREKANGKQTKSVQVADWGASREAWSSEKATDSRTKPTRWEFHTGSRQHGQNLAEQFHLSQSLANQTTDQSLSNNLETQVKIRAKNSARNNAHSSLNNSRTNLIINDDISLERIDDKNNVENGKNLNGTKNSMRLHSEGAIEQQLINEMIDSRHINESINLVGNSSYKNLELGKDNDIYSNAFDKENIYANINHTTILKNHPQVMMGDKIGKEILLRRFIEEQPNGNQIIREHFQVVPGDVFIQNMPNEIPQNKLGELYLESSQPGSLVFVHQNSNRKTKNEQEDDVYRNVDGEGDGDVYANTSRSKITDPLTVELASQLQQSLKQQNELLTKILMEKERINIATSENYMPLETQSLPGNSLEIATQTEREAQTQTDANFDAKDVSFDELTRRRRARSENDESFSDDSYEYVNLNFPDSSPGSKVKKKKPKKRFKSKGGQQQLKRIIILDEVRKKLRSPIIEEMESQTDIIKPSRDTKANILRRKKNEQKLQDQQIRSKLNNQNEANPNLNSRLKKRHKQLVSSDNGSDIYYNIDSDTDNEIIIQTSFPANKQSFPDSNRKEKHHFSIHISSGDNELSRSKNKNSTKYISHDVDEQAQMSSSNAEKSSAAIKKLNAHKNHAFEVGQSDVESEKIPHSNASTSTSNQADIIGKEFIKVENNIIPGTKQPKEKAISITRVNSSHEQNQLNGVSLSDNLVHNQIPSSNISTEYKRGRSTTQTSIAMPYPDHDLEAQKIKEVSKSPSHSLNSSLVPDNKRILFIEDQSSSHKTSSTSQKQLNAATLEDDHDSGIAMNSFLHKTKQHIPITEKKSVFTIAFDNVSRVEKITSRGESPQNS